MDSGRIQFLLGILYGQRLKIRRATHPQQAGSMVNSSGHSLQEQHSHSVFAERLNYNQARIG